MKKVDIPETIAASDLKVSRSSHLIEYMKVCEYWFKLYFNCYKYTDMKTENT